MSVFCWTFVFTLIFGSVTAFLFDVINGPTTNNAEPPLRIGAMNVQVFGTTKLQHEIVRSVLPRILTRYDVVLVQEIRDLTDSAFETLRHLMNEELKAKHVNDVYEKVVSNRLGRTNSKEQYGFLFRKSKVHLTDSYQYPDPGDIFEREPFVVHFSSPQTAVADFAIAGIHTSPTHAKDEIGNLTKVYDAIKQHWHLDNVIIMGDFNMDCSYVSHTASRLNPLRQDSRFVWLIGDGLDTTIGDETHCTYDRIVLGGTQLQHSVTPGSVHVFRFDEEWHIPKDQAKLISDHYPIEFAIQGKPK